MSQQQVAGFVLVESRSNCRGIEVRLERLAGVLVLRAYRLGRPVAHASVSSARLGGRPVIENDSVPAGLRCDVEDALDEGLRLYRDGRGLCEAA